MDTLRPRAREIGIDIGIFRPGPHNALTDVAGVRVGHVTLIEGEGKLIPGRGPIRTGVTAVLPHGGNLFREKVPAATFALNAFGKSAGFQQLNEVGNLETPILLTNTLNVGIVADAVVEWSIRQSPEIGISTGTVNPVVGEISDSFLNDLQGRHVREEHVFQAINGAQTGPVAEGSVGGGTGGTCMGFKGGIGTASRVLPEKLGGYTLGALVQTNFSGSLVVNGAPVGRELGRYPFNEQFPYPAPEHPQLDGSVMVVVATDAPLDQRLLERLARRVGVGLGRTGFYGSNASGDFFLAFSTAQRVPHQPGPTLGRRVVNNDAMSPLFLAAEEAVEESVVNSILRATTVTGRDGHTAEAIDVDDLLRVLRKYNALGWNESVPPWGSADR